MESQGFWYVFASIVGTVVTLVLLRAVLSIRRIVELLERIAAQTRPSADSSAPATHRSAAASAPCSVEITEDNVAEIASRLNRK